MKRPLAVAIAPPLHSFQCERERTCASCSQQPRRHRSDALESAGDSPLSVHTLLSSTGTAQTLSSACHAPLQPSSVSSTSSTSSPDEHLPVKASDNSVASNSTTTCSESNRLDTLSSSNTTEKETTQFILSELDDSTQETRRCTRSDITDVDILPGQSRDVESLTEMQTCMATNKVTDFTKGKHNCHNPLTDATSPLRITEPDYAHCSPSDRRVGIAIEEASLHYKNRGSREGPRRVRVIAKALQESSVWSKCQRIVVDQSCRQASYASSKNEGYKIGGSSVNDSDILVHCKPYTVGPDSTLPNTRSVAFGLTDEDYLRVLSPGYWKR
jgi:hypothetical protein